MKKPFYIGRLPAEVDREGLTAVGLFLTKQQREILPGVAVDMNLAAANLYGFIAQGFSFIAFERATEEVIGALILVESTRSWAAAAENTCLVDQAYVVAKEWRGKGVGEALKSAAAAAAREAGKPAFIFKAIPLVDRKDRAFPVR